MGWLKNAWAWIRHLPVAKWIKPLWKGALKDIVQTEGDALQAKARAAIAEEGSRAVDRIIDAWQEKLKAGIQRLPLPSGIAGRLMASVDTEGDELQKRLKQAIETGSPGAVDAVFDSSQAILLSRIDAL